MLFFQEIYHLLKNTVHEVAYNDADAATYGIAISSVIVSSGFLTVGYADFLRVPLAESSKAFVAFDLLSHYSNFVAE
jgi:hypothetical protein